MGTLQSTTGETLAYHSHFDDVTGTGILVISGLNLPENKKFCVLSKIWSSLKKRIHETHEIHIVGLFNKKDDETLCQFIINTAAIEEKKEFDKHLARFRESFDELMTMFIRAVELFLASDAFTAYLECVEKPDATADDFKRIINSFLIANGYKKPEDQARKKAKEKRTR